MAKRTFVSFDWAIKKILRDKEKLYRLGGFSERTIRFRCNYRKPIGKRNE